MAIREFEFSVTQDGITPATEQKVSMQTEHAATVLKFNINSSLYSKLLTEKGEGSLAYRFDCYDSTGGTVKTDSNPLESDTVSFTVGENLTRHGGRAAVYLVITAYSADGKTKMELLSYPARLRFENIPEAGADNGAARESLTTLAEAAREAAERAETARETAVTAQGKTEEAAAAIESGSEFLFDGGGADNSLKVECVTDFELSETSENPIANKAVYARFEQTDAAISAKADSAAVASAVASAIAAAKAELLLLVFPVGSIYASVSDASPADLFGGSWERIKGAFLWGAEDGETAGTAGGEKTHTLTVSEMPANIGSFKTLSWKTDNAATGAFTNVEQLADRADTTGELYGTAEYTLSGGGQPHNNMPPYIAVYLWKRTA